MSENEGAREPMLTDGTRRRRFVLLLASLFVLAACAHHHQDDDAANDEINSYPKTYKSDILGAMHAYLNDPTGVRDGSLSEPALKSVSGEPKHYAACVRFNAKKKGNEYAGVKEIVAVFIAGRFDHFVDTPKVAGEVCAGASYAPFPELAALTR